MDITGLVREARYGNAEAFGELYELYSREMFTYAYAMVHNETDAADAVSEAALEAFKQVKNLRDETKFKWWLFKILNAACKRQYIKSTAGFDFVYIDDEDKPLNDLTAKQGDSELSYDLERTLSTLDREEKEIVMLSVVHEYTSTEIAEITGLNPSTVRSKLKRALKKCRDNFPS